MELYRSYYKNCAYRSYYDDSHGDDEIIVALGNPKPVKDEYSLTDDWKHVYIKLPGETSFTRYERSGESAQSSYGLRNAVLIVKKVEVEETASNENTLIYDDMNMLIQFGYNHSSNFHFLHRVQKDKEEIISKYPFGKFSDDIVSVRHIIRDDDYKNFFIEYELKYTDKHDYPFVMRAFYDSEVKEFAITDNLTVKDYALYRDGGTTDIIATNDQEQEFNIHIPSALIGGRPTINSKEATAIDWQNQTDWNFWLDKFSRVTKYRVYRRLFKFRNHEVD